MLKMKASCEKCGADTGWADVAYICSYECTFCAACTSAMSSVCPNCNGGLVRRPVRQRGPAQLVASRLRGRLRGLFGHS